MNRYDSEQDAEEIETGIVSLVVGMFIGASTVAIVWALVHFFL